MTDERIRVVIEGDADDLRSALRGAAADLRTFGVVAGSQTKSLGAMGTVVAQQQRNLQALGRAARYAGVGLGTTLAFGLAKAVKDGFAFNAQMESNQLALKGMLGGAKEARQYLDELYETAKRTPFEFADLTSASRRLLAFGLEAKETQRILAATGDAVAAMGGGAENIDRVTLALGQMQAKGRVSAEELLQLTEAGIPAYKILADQLGLTRDQVADIGNAGISSERAIHALTVGMEEEFGGAAAEQARTWSGLTSTIQDNWAQMTGALTEDLFKELEGWAPAVNRTMEGITRIFQDRDLGLEEQIDASVDLIDRRLGPIWEEITGKWDSADVGEKIVEGVEWAIPKVAAQSGRLGVEVAKGMASGFIHADALGKLFIAGSFIRFLGGPGVFGKIGVAMGQRISASMSSTVAAEAGTAAAASQFSQMGTIAGKLIGPAMGLGIVAMLASDPMVQEAIKNLAGELLDAPKREDFATKLEDWFDIPSGSARFLGRARVQIQTELGTLVFNSENEKLVRAQSAKLKDLVGKDMSAVFQEFERQARKPNKVKFDELLGNLKHVRGEAEDAGRGWDRYLDRLDSSLDKGSESAGRHRGKVTTELGRIVGGLDATEKKGDDYEGSLTRNFSRVTSKSSSMSQGVGSAIKDLGNAVAAGMARTEGDLNRALKAMGVDKVSFGISTVGNAASDFGRARGGLVEMARGGISRVVGQGLDDTVPLYANGVARAVVAPGEDLAVINRHQRPMLDAAVARTYGVNGLREFFGRFNRPHYMARGGTVPGPTGGVDSGVLDLVTSLYQRFGGQVTSGVRPGDDGFHGRGLALDYAPANWAGAAAAVNQVGARLLEGIYNPATFGGPAVSWDSGSRVSPSFWGGATWADHMDHIHLAVSSGASVLAGAVRELRRVMLKGPDGAFTGVGQAALDRVHQAAQKYLDSLTPEIGLEPMGKKISGLPSALQKYNRQYAEAPAPSHLTAPKMPFEAVAALAEWAGMPGISMAKTAIGESALAPGASGIDPGGTKGLGLWMVTTGFNDALIKRFGGQDSMFNPVLNAQAANSIWQSQGYGAWYSATKDTSNTHYTGPLLKAAGGLLPMLASGGLDVGNVVRRVGLVDPGKRKKILSRLTDKIKDLKLEPRLQDRIERVTEDIRVFDEHATRAGDLTSFRDDGKQATVAGRTEAEWLSKALPKMATLRNLFITADRHLDRMREALEKQQKQAGAELKRIEKKLRDIGRERQDLEKEKSKDSTSKSRREAIDKKLKSLGETEQTLTLRRNALHGRIVPALKGQIGQLTSKDRSIMGPDGLLEGLQGPDAPLRKMRHLPDRLGVFGGSIYEAQKRLYELGHPVGADDSDLADLLSDQLRDAQLTARLSEAQFSTFEGFFDEFRAQLPFVGSFDHGVARVPFTGFARVHKDETILPDPQGPFVNGLATKGHSPPPVINVYVDGEIGPMVKRMRAEIDGYGYKTINRRLGRNARQLRDSPGFQ